MQGWERSTTRADILGCHIDVVDMARSLHVIEDFIYQGKPRQVITLNAEIAHTAFRQPELRRLINHADLVTPDGAGVVWAARFLGYPVRERVTGIDLMEALAGLSADRGWGIFLLGAQPGIAARAADNLSQRYPGLKVIGTHHGYFGEQETSRIVTQIKVARPDILFVGLGAPYQEFWISRHLSELGTPVAIGVGGSLDVLAGKASRAPGIMIRLNLEWLYRLVKEPRRWRRQLALPSFVLEVIMQRLSPKRYR